MSSQPLLPPSPYLTRVIDTNNRKQRLPKKFLSIQTVSIISRKGLSLSSFESVPFSFNTVVRGRDGRTSPPTSLPAVFFVFFFLHHPPTYLFVTCWLSTNINGGILSGIHDMTRGANMFRTILLLALFISCSSAVFHPGLSRYLPPSSFENWNYLNSIPRDSSLNFEPFWPFESPLDIFCSCVEEFWHFWKRWSKMRSLWIRSCLWPIAKKRRNKRV